MTEPVKISLAAQRCLLQKQLRAQRQQIAEQLTTPATAASHYPRSMTMRFFTGRSGIRLVSEAATFVLGPHYARSIALAKMASRVFFSRKSNS